MNPDDVGMSLFAAAVQARRRRAVLPVAAAVLALGACTAHVSPAAVRTPAAGQPPRTLYDLAYAHVSPQERLDLYLPRQADRPAPLVIWIHGGGWRVGDKRAIANFPGPSSSPPPRANCRDIVQVQVPPLH
jgi:acetyl esterase/lipase